MVRAEELTEAALISAMREGNFYSSSGVSISDFGIEKDRYWLQIDAQEGVTYETHFIGTRSDGVEIGPPGVVLGRSAELRPEYRFSGDELYVRALVVSSRLHPDPHSTGDYESAWLPPRLGPAAP